MTEAPAIPTTRFGFHPDDTTPIPRPSRYYGQRQGPSLKEQFSQLASSAPPIAPVTRGATEKIDKSALALPEPKRRRDKSHLRFVASQPCLVCGRHPSDPHHLRFAQPRALGLKVSDEFTVPLCRGHHRQLHQAGNEVGWWQRVKIDPLHSARQFWQQTHPNEGQVSPTVEETEIAGPRSMTTEKQIAANRENAKKSTRTSDVRRQTEDTTKRVPSWLDRRNAGRNRSKNRGAYEALRAKISEDFRPRDKFGAAIGGATGVADLAASPRDSDRGGTIGVADRLIRKSQSWH